jgi:hypothetical protein
MVRVEIEVPDRNRDRSLLFPLTSPLALRLLPWFVCKLGGRSAACFDELRATATLELGREVERLEADLLDLAGQIGAALFGVVAGCADAGARARVLALRRDVHNLRPLDERRIEELAVLLPAATVRACRDFRALGLRGGELRRAARERFSAERSEIRRRVQAYLRGNFDFQRGLMLSSRSLSGQLENYLASPPDRLRAKEAQVERGLLRYLSRMVMKASPFGTFCGIAIGRVADLPASGPAAAVTLAGDPARKRLVVRLNKNLRLLAQERLASDPEARRQLLVEINPTLQREGTRWTFLALAEERETLQRLAAAPALEELVRWLAPQRTAPYGAIVGRLIATHAAADATAAGALADRLLAIGFLRFAPLTPDHARDWDFHLRRRLGTLAGSEARRLSHGLARLSGLARRYSRAPASASAELLAAAERSARSCFAPANGGEERLDGLLLYEDAAAAASLTLARSALTHLMPCLLEVVRFAAVLAPAREEQAKMRAFFHLTYGGADAVPLLQFFEAYAHAYFKRHVERVKASFRPRQDASARPLHPVLDDPGAIELVAAMRRANRRLGERMIELWRRDPDAAEIGLERDDLAACLDGVPPPALRPSSVSVFGQPLPRFAPDGGLGLVLGLLSAGFGKYFSRFLPLLPRGLTEALRRRYRQASGPVLAEIYGDSDFNANLHPPLLPHALRYPTSGSAAPPGALETRDLAVAPDPLDPHALRLTHPDYAEPIVPVDLGFENPSLRPPLFQLLAYLAPAAAFAFTFPETGWPAREREEGYGDDVQYRPRVVYAHTLVLARRRWRVTAAAFPHRRTGEGEADYFLRVNAWRRRFGIPREVFVALRPEPRDAAAAAPPTEPLDPPPAAPARASRQHLYKPQYLDFANPLLVDLLSRLPGPHARFTASFTERLPSAEHLLRTADGQPWAAELVLQVDCDRQRSRQPLP